MSISSYSTPQVSFSITNPNIARDEARDIAQPFSFLDFINFTKVDYTPDEYSRFYTSYIKQWYSNKDLTQQEQEDEFKAFYTNFIQEIVLNFTTESERRFLSKIDYSSPTDLDVVLPFYANKIREIVIFYKNKREEGKYVIDRNKMKGSSSGVERAIFDNIYNFLFGSQDTLSTSNIQLSSLITKLDIDIEEYIDIYGDYFDLPRTRNCDHSDAPDSISTENEIRQELYSSNVNDIDPDYYFDPDAIKALTTNVFLSTVPAFYINPPNVEVFVDNVCDPNNALNEAIDSRTKGSLTPSDIYSLKRALISKYCSADFYYINTTTSPPTSGILFTAQNPTNNILNIQTADTATVESNEIRLLKDIGLFFKPNKHGLFKVSADKSEYQIDVNQLQDDQIYIFPDPKAYSNVSSNPQSAYPASFRFDYRDGIRNISSGIASGDPYVTNTHQTFNGYSSKESNNNNLSFYNENGYKFNFSDLYNQGLLQKVQYDIFGNEYGLFKTDSLAKVEDLTNINILDLLLDGHLFFDRLEGYNFDYSTAGEYGSTIRSGLSTFTNGFDPLSSFFTLYFREFSPYQDFQISNTRDITLSIRDCAQFTFINGDPLPDPLSSSDINWPGSGNYYYSVLANGTPGITPDFTVDTRFNLSASDYYDYDCGYFTDNTAIPNDFNYSKNYRFINTVDSRFTTQLSTLTAANILTQSERRGVAGKLYVKNQRFSSSSPLSTAFASTLAKYSQTIQNDINSNLTTFDVIRDVIVLETPSALIFEKISYSNGQFSNTNANNTLFDIVSSNQLTKVSNRLLNEQENKVYFTITNPLSVSYINSGYTPKNNWRIIPEIYEYDLNTNTSRKLFPSLDATLPDELSGFVLGSIRETYNFAPVAIKTPTITYNSRNNIYKVTFIVIDNNNQSHICDVDFVREENKLKLVNIKSYNSTGFSRSTTFNNDFGTFFAKISATSGSFSINENDNTLVL
jgi:hypothetical protein